MKCALSYFWFAFPAIAHVMSMSSGDLTIQGTRGHYELRMPIYEVAHIKDPDRSIFEHIHFSSGLREARLVSKSCQPDNAGGSYVCNGEYDFAVPPEHIEVVCTYPAITVPNHVHLLRAEMGADKRDQAVFDLSFSRATLWFRPPTPLETAVMQTGAGFVRAWGGAVQLLFLAALVLAGRSVRELLLLSVMFLAGQIASVILLPHTGWHPAPRFVEAAAALTVAYLAIEILVLPHAGARWAIAAVLGAFHGLYFHLFLQTTRYQERYVLSGAAVAEIIAIGVLGLAFSQIIRLARVLRPVQVSAGALLAFGMVWFFLRLRS